MFVMLIIVAWFGFGVFVSDEECVDCVSSLWIEWWKCCWWFKSDGWWPTRWFEYDGCEGAGISCCGCWKCVAVVVGGGWRWWWECPTWWDEANGVNCDDDRS